jgi:hypothetical protein
MSVFNQCSHLVSKEKLEEVRNYIGDYTRNGRDGFQLVLDMQLNIQRELAKALPQNGNVPTESLTTCGQKVDFLREQMDNISDEFRELLTSLGGMSNGEKDATSVWKKWKKNNQEFRNKQYSDLPESDRLEVAFEMIDIMHFVANMITVLEIDSQELVELYMIKNAENLRRYQSNY